MIEKTHIKNKGDKSLSCVFNNGKPDAPILLLLHGFAGNKEENGLFIEADEYFSERNFNVFRFDFEGAGESEGDYSMTTLERQAGDLESAVDYLTNKYPNNDIGIVGFSLGATVSIIKNDPRIKAYAFWSPVLNPSKDMYPRYNTKDLRNEFETKGFLDKAGLRVGSSIISDFKTCELKPYIMNIDRPTLLVHGTADPRIDYKTTEYFDSVFIDSRMVLIEGANHSYKNNSSHRQCLFEENVNFFSRELFKLPIPVIPDSHRGFSGLETVQLQVILMCKIIIACYVFL